MHSKTKRRMLAEEILRIMETGEYVAPSGRTVSIREWQHVAEMGTQLYRPRDLDDLPGTPYESGATTLPEIGVFNETTFVGARHLLDEGAEQVCSLNFASAKNPGGRFLGGAEA